MGLKRSERWGAGAKKLQSEHAISFDVKLLYWNYHYRAFLTLILISTTEQITYSVKLHSYTHTPNGS